MSHERYVNLKGKFLFYKSQKGFKSLFIFVLKSQSLLEYVTKQTDLSVKLPSERCPWFFVHFESEPQNHRFTEPEGSFKTICLLPNATDHERAVHLWANMLYIFFIYRVLLKD